MSIDDGMNITNLYMQVKSYIPLVHPIHLLLKKTQLNDGEGMISWAVYDKTCISSSEDRTYLTLKNSGKNIFNNT